jgi:hypothetical protein
VTLFTPENRQGVPVAPDAQVAPLVPAPPSIGEVRTTAGQIMARLRDPKTGCEWDTVQTFATNWLVPRLGTFQVAHPEIAVRLGKTLDARLRPQTLRG